MEVKTKLIDTFEEYVSPPLINLFLVNQLQGVTIRSYAKLLKGKKGVHPHQTVR